MKLLKPCLLLFWLTFGMPLNAAEIVDLKVFSEDDYLRVAFSLDRTAEAQVEANISKNLVFVRFDSTGIGSMAKQSFLYADNPHLESVTFLPLGQGSTVARVKARHPFKIKTYEISDPPRFVLELNDVRGKAINRAEADKTQVVDYYRRGIQQMQKGSFNAALMSFRSAIRAGNRVADSYFHAGVIRYRLYQVDKALINFSRANTSSVYGDEARLYLAWIHYKKSNYPAMRTAWRKFVNRLPDRSARLALAEKHPQIDYRILEAAIEAAGGENAELTGSGMAAAENSRLNIPERGTTGVDQDSAAVYFERAIALKADGRLEQAARALEDAVRCDPDYSQAFFQLGVIYKSLDKHKLSAANFEKSLGRQSSAGQSKAEKIEISAAAASETFPEPGLSQAPSPIEQYSSKQTLPGVNPSGSGPTGANEKTLVASSGQLKADKESSFEDPAAGTAGSLIGTARSSARKIISLAQAGLFREQVWLLTLITGILFTLTLLGEQIFVGWFFRRKAAASRKIGQVVDVYRNSSSIPRTGNTVKKDQSPIDQRKKQVAEILASELAAKQQADNVSEADESSGRHIVGSRLARGNALELRLNPAVNGGIYGDNIARRIKQELSGIENNRGPDSMTGKFGKGRSDVQTRLIRQLRSKDWSIGDIAQEMNLSREEVKWALATPAPTEGSSGLGLPGESHRARYGQARALLDREGSDFQRVAQKIDREVDLELQIDL
jgi:tetratricopeptide (TPR) repeat protein